MNISDDALRDHLVSGFPFLDVRAPVEFAGGALPGAVNLPILDDDERARVGTTYKQSGPAAAMELGHDLVSGAVREARIEGWRRWVADHPNAMLYCFRGGQRSRLAAAWLAEAGCRLPRLDGGYKRARQLLMADTARLATASRWFVVGGKTGTGKTLLLDRVGRALDLEGVAAHRGSAFGRLPTPQPAPVDFENVIARDLLRLHATGERSVLVEDEGRRIGRLSVPTPLVDAMSAAPVVVLEAPLAERVEHIYSEYIIAGSAAWGAAPNSAAGDFKAFSAYLLGAVDAIRKRLGGVRHVEVRALVEAALTAQAAGDPGLHRAWIERLLIDYYDPMYEYQLQNKAHRVVMTGTADMLISWLQEAMQD